LTPWCDFWRLNVAHAEDNPVLERDIEIEIDEPDIALDADEPGGYALDRSARTFDIDGRLRVANCRISKANISPYFGGEIPNGPALGLDPGRLYDLYRHRDALNAAVPTFENVPLLIQHEAVSAASPKKSITVGTVSNVRYQHPYLVADIAVWDADAIQLIESGAQRELSCGYRYVAHMMSGSLDGKRYDGVMRDIVGNHVALVAQGRAGPDVMVTDSAYSSLEAMFPGFGRLSRCC
jgi:hypothetical protein